MTQCDLRLFTSMSLSQQAVEFVCETGGRICLRAAREAPSCELIQLPELLMARGGFERLAGWLRPVACRPAGGSVISEARARTESPLPAPGPRWSALWLAEGPPLPALLDWSLERHRFASGGLASSPSRAGSRGGPTSADGPPTPPPL